MAKIRLETADGSFVFATEMPHFVPPPRVVLWGSRVFEFHDFDAGVTAATSTRVYREVFFWAVPS